MVVSYDWEVIYGNGRFGMSNIGLLTDISPREAWSHEAIDFTPWLAENLAVLGEGLGIQLEFESKETSVGGYFADIVARCPQDDRVVLIENQLEKSNHGHLGQVMTYLAGTDAQIIVWIATDFSEPHLAALKWLNEHTVDPFAFFAVRLRVVRIGGSDPAPMFEVLERPNNWERQMHAVQRENRTQSPRASQRQAYWSKLVSICPELENQGITLNGSSSQWLVPDDVSCFVISIYIAIDGVGLFLRGPRGSTPADVFERFEAMSDRFKQLVGGEMKDATASSHPVCFLKIDTTKSENWEKAALWQCEKAMLWLQATSEVFADSIV